MKKLTNSFFLIRKINIQKYFQFSNMTQKNIEINTFLNCFPEYYISLYKNTENAQNLKKSIGKKLLIINSFSFNSHNKNKPKQNPDDLQKPNPLNSEKPEKKESFYKRLKKLMKEYGKKAYLLYFILYILGLGLSYKLVKHGYVNKDFKIFQDYFDINAMCKKYGENNINLILTFSINEIIEIPRILLVILIFKLLIKKK